MKKFFLGLAFCVATLCSYGQFSAGIKGGVNFSKLESEYLTTDSETGYYGGIFGNYAINEEFAIQPEVYFSHQAGETSGFEYSFDYLAVPLLLQIRFAPVNIYAGAHLGFLLNVDAPGVEKEDFKGTALSGVIGAGFEFKVPLEIGGRYVHGLSDISDNPVIQDVHFRMWEIYAAWRLFGSR